MKLLTDLLPGLLLYGFVAIACLFALALLFWVCGLTILPFHWVAKKLNDTRCPQCRGFFKRKLVDWEVADEREVLKTVNRVDEGTLFSNRLFEPNQAIEINRQEQVTFVEKTILNHWLCKEPLCGHEWTTEDYSEYEGALDK